MSKTSRPGPAYPSRMHREGDCDGIHKKAAVLAQGGYVPAEAAYWLPAII